jgi:hypothetical protein
MNNKARKNALIRTLVVTAALAMVATMVTMMPGSAQARDAEDCQLWWGQAVRSYLTQNRTKGPEDEAFKSACDLEKQGDKAGARVEAITVGCKALAGLDMKGCTNFMGKYVGATLPGKICEAAKGDDVAALRKLVEGSLPPAPKPRESAQ